MENFQVYRDIQARTGGDIYIGVVGPVRTGKSTFITNFMQKLVLPLGNWWLCPEWMKKCRKRSGTSFH